MSRARTQKQEEKVDFFKSNPEAIDQDTVITVEKTGGRHEAVATGKAAPADNDFEFDINKISLLSDLDTEDADFNFWSDGEPIGGEEYGFGGGEDYLSLSKDGIGIMGEDEMLGEDGGGYTVPREARAIDDGETLSFMLDSYYYDGFPEMKKKHKGEGDEEEESSFLDYSDADPGGTATNIQFTVLNNKEGTVELEIFGEDEGLIATKTVEVEAGQKGTMLMVGHVMDPNTTFDGWDFSVEGDVQVAITEIGYSTNFDPDMFAPA